MFIIREGLMKSICALVFLSVVAAACTNSCDDVVCFNQGVCIDGECECPWPYHGSDCQLQYDLTGSAQYWLPDSVLNAWIDSFAGEPLPLSRQVEMRINFNTVANPNFGYLSQYVSRPSAPLNCYLGSMLYTSWTYEPGTVSKQLQFTARTWVDSIGWQNVWQGTTAVAIGSECQLIQIGN